MTISRRLSSLSLRIALAALFVAAGNAQTGAPVPWSAAINSSKLFLKSDSIAKPAPRSILLIGENHASVKTQTQLADLLQLLYRDHSVDAILVEGSNGRIDASDLRGSLASLSQKSTAEFWRGQLDLGQIAGYEYIALTNDGIRVWGVEDMDAKRKYTADAARRSAETGLQEQIDLHTRAIALAKDALSGVDSSARHPADAAIGGYEAKIAEFRALKQKSGVQYAAAEGAYSDSLERMTALYAKLRTVLPAYDQLAKQAEPYNRLLDRAKKLSAGGSSSSDADAAKLLADLQAAKSRIEKASADFELASKKAGYPTAEAAVADLKQIGDNETSFKTSEEQLTKLGNAFGELEGELTNQFFLAANAVRTVLGKPAPALQSFLRDQREKARADANDPEKPYLSDRDQHMVANTMAYFGSNPSVKNVALIIGYAHLEGMTKRLAAENVSVVAGKIAASEEETEAWENRAWERRSLPAAHVFSRAERKELSRLLDDTYKTEMPALLAKLQAVSANPASGIALGKTKIFEASTKTTGRKAIVTASADSLRSDWGSQVVQMGVMPDGKGTAYMVFDRDRGREEAKALSDANTAFATIYRTRGQQGLSTMLDTSAGTVGMESFKARAPRSGQSVPKRFVIAPEGDERALKAALGAGGAGSEPPWTSGRAIFAEPPEGKRPILFVTKNMRRASERLKEIEKQDPLKIGKIATVEIGLGAGENGPGLNDQWFTPDTGEHAHAYLIVGDNTPEFRKSLKAAADAGLLRNKQIALATCFDENESNALHDMLLDAGALMVWSPGRRVSPEAARKLQGYMEKVDALPGPVRGMDEYMNRTLELWHKVAPSDPDLQQFLDSTNRAELALPGGTDDLLGE
jgi:hypothetical protein